MKRIAQLQTEFFESEALRDGAADEVACHELDAAQRVAELFDLDLSVDEVAELLDTNAKTVRALRSRVSAQAGRSTPHAGGATARAAQEASGVRNAVGPPGAAGNVSPVGPAAVADGAGVRVPATDG
jgi:hypothetical protein